MIYTNEILSEQRQSADLSADLFVQQCFVDAQAKTALRDYLNQLVYNKQLTSLPDSYINEPLFVNATVLPAWADKKHMQQGAAFFARHAGLIMNMLGLLSLPYCYAAADGAKVLYLSERIRNDTAKRLQETGEFVWDVMSPDAFESNGKGFASILKVRLIHAGVRFYTLQSGRWDMSWGQPVNQEDMAGTNLSFSLLVIRGLRKLDVAVSYADQQAFMHLWNVIGFMSGVEEALLPETGKQAIALEQAISSRQFRTSMEGQALTQALIQYFKSLKLEAPLSSGDIVQLMRYLLGTQVADLLNIPAVSFPKSTITLLKLTGTLQELKPISSVVGEYRQQYADFRKQQSRFA